jgi:hypothetical protein
MDPKQSVVLSLLRGRRPPVISRFPLCQSPCSPAMPTTIRHLEQTSAYSCYSTSLLECCSSDYHSLNSPIDRSERCWTVNSLFSLVHVYCWEGIQRRRSPFPATRCGKSEKPVCKLLVIRPTKRKAPGGDDSQLQRCNSIAPAIAAPGGKRGKAKRTMSAAVRALHRSARGSRGDRRSESDLHRREAGHGGCPSDDCLEERWSADEWA